MVFRATRGKVLTHIRDLELSEEDQRITNETKAKCIYVLVFAEGSRIRERLTKICDSFMGRIFDIPHFSSRQVLNTTLESLQNRIDEAKMLIMKTKMSLREHLSSINIIPATTISLIELYKSFVQKEKALYSELNKLKQKKGLFFGFFWCPITEVAALNRAIETIR